MHDHSDHTKLIKDVAQQYADILQESEQAVYIYLEDEAKVCNKNFSDLLGYKSPGEWAKVNTSFPEAFVADESQQELVSTYQKAMETMSGSLVDIVWKKKDGEKVKTKVILVPIEFDGHLFALHFVSQI